ncbi:MAG: GerMN domain-containing protein [Treponema sp.]|nr:GerMN domain-containing protein [Treponema sp.]MEE3434050.1 GerMN domain-containing protein [Treponema sp.]
MSGKNSKKAKRNGIFAAVWLLLILILIIVFLVKKDDFAANLKSTNFFERVVGTTPEFLQNYETKKKDNKSNGLLDVDVAPVPGQKETQDPGTYDLDDLNSQGEQEQAAATSSESAKEEEAAQEAASAKEEEKKPGEEKPKPAATTNAKLFFVQVDADGNVNRKSVVRQIPKSDSPLTDTIKALLAGPLDSEKSMSLIPPGTRLLSATVRNGIAALNFSEEFEFNSIGADGYRGQLMQIVFTATEFATVESVQFLIEGQRKEYIGSGEDVWMWIGSPYTRSSFN